MNIIILLWTLICVDFGILVPYVIIKKYPFKISFLICCLAIVSFTMLLALTLTEAYYAGIL